MDTGNASQRAMGEGPPRNDRVDDLFDYDVGIDDILRSIDSQANGLQTQADPQSVPTGPTAALGLDEEVKVSRKRQPVPKLDEAR
jgi:replication fork protection complex subunit Csm3/Swi3